MQGFFTIKETESVERPGGRKYTCIACGAYKNCQSPRMEAYGKFKKKILVVGSTVERYDDQQGIPFQSKYGVYLRNTLSKLGIDLYNDCLSITAAKCAVYNEDNNTTEPSNYLLECCRKSILKLIEDKKPKLIIILGNSALFSLIGHRWKKELDKIEKWRGWTIPDQDYGCWVCPTYDPKTVVQWNRPEMEVIFKQDLKEAIKCLNKEFPISKTPTIKIIEDLRVLNDIKKISAFDYETTGLKPHAKGHKIICCSIAVNEDLVYVFMIPEDKKKLQPFIEYLKDRKRKKIAQNMKFEETWSSVILKTPVQGWKLDTMLMTHILDNRKGITSVKFQTYVQFGVVDYASEVSPFLKSIDPDSANSMNRIEELISTKDGKKKLLVYCGYDSIYEYRLAMLQMKLISE